MKAVIARLPGEIRGTRSGVVQRRDHAVDWPRWIRGATSSSASVVPAHIRSRSVLFELFYDPRGD